MKIYIIADLEGVSGVVDREQLVPGGYRYEEACKELTGELNCVVEGCLKAGAKEIIVHDGHNFGFNINRNLLHSKAKLITKGSRILIDNKFSALILVGYHGKAGSSAVLSHTYSFNSIKNLKFNGISVGEIGWHALIAGHYNIPVVLVSGCDVTCKEACNLLGKVETVVTKESIDKNSAICYSSEEIKKNLKEMAYRALKNVGNYKPFKLKYPIEMVIEYYTNYSARRACRDSKLKLISNNKVMYLAKDITDATNNFRAPKPSLLPPILKIIYKIIRKKAEDLGIY